jgi:hypothetical protein
MNEPLPSTLGTPAQRALIEPLFRAHREGSLTLHAAINAVVTLFGTSRVPAVPSIEPGLPSHPTSEEIRARLKLHKEWAEQMSVVLWDEHARAAMRQAANNFELALGYIREKPSAVSFDSLLDEANPTPSPQRMDER